MRKCARRFRFSPGARARVLLASAGLSLILMEERVPAATSREPLRVCADPNNMPFSNVAGKGFENRIARLLARDLGRPLEYTWWAQRRGFFGNTLNTGVCDVVIGAPVGLESAEVTRPYYRSSYVFVSRADRDLRIDSFDDPRLKRLKIGVQVLGGDSAKTPPVRALSARGVVDNVVGFSVLGDYRKESPPSEIVKAVQAQTVDVAVVWGPLAGYYARRARPLLVLTRATMTEWPGIPLEFEIGMAVRHGDGDRKRELESFLERRRTEIRRILDEYGVPRS